MVGFGIPLFANIHLCGSVLTETFFVMIVHLLLKGELPSVGTMILFCALLGIFAIGAPGVPGGTVMASLGIVTSVLGLGDDGTGLLLAIFAIGAPGVPGGTVMASLGIVTSVLGLGDDGTALLLAIFAIQDSFGTACNVTGDGALALILTGYCEKHGLEDQSGLNVEL